MPKPYSESCEQNKEAILSIIQPLLSRCSNVLEIGSGTGQHAIYFAEKMPYLQWLCSDRSEFIAGINQWLDESDTTNVIAPLVLDVSKTQWPAISVDAVFTANTVHIMHDDNVIDLVRGVNDVLNEGGHFFIYGPFNYKGEFTSSSNTSFDLWLKNNDALSGIKDFEKVEGLAEACGLKLCDDYEMPANNRILHFIKL